MGAILRRLRCLWDPWFTPSGCPVGWTIRGMLNALVKAVKTQSQPVPNRLSCTTNPTQNLDFAIRLSLFSDSSQSIVEWLRTPRDGWGSGPTSYADSEDGACSRRADGSARNRYVTSRW